jgi:CRISPR-associated protein Cmr3
MTVMTYLYISPRDPLIARDGRPFGSGQSNRMRCLDWFYPSVLAGSLRTMVGKSLGYQFDTDQVALLKNIEVAGPLPCRDNRLYAPAPLDCVIQRDPDRAIALRPAPLKDGEGTDLPEPGLQPCQMPTNVEEGFKPGTGPPFWRMDRIADWLADTDGRSCAVPPRVPLDVGNTDYLDPVRDQRVHVALDAATGAAREHMLFMSEGIVLPDGVGISARVKAPDGNAQALSGLDALHSFGGERRTARFQVTDHSQIWSCPEKVRQALKGGNLVRMILATPAVFAGGWKPGWLDEHLEGSPPGCRLRLRLMGACVDRWRPVSGWSLEPPRGPKAIRRLAPAGSVYFFEVADGEAADSLASLWLESVCDEEQARRDGFGLTLWGVWSPHQEG